MSNIKQMSYHIVLSSVYPQKAKSACFFIFLKASNMCLDVSGTCSEKYIKKVLRDITGYPDAYWNVSNSLTKIRGGKDFF